MADYVSSCPISWPVKLDWKPTWDMGGMLWSYQHGMFYEPDSLLQNIKLPSVTYRALQS